MLSVLPQPKKVSARPGRLQLALPLTMTGGPGTQATLQYVNVLLGDHARLVSEPPAQLRLDLDGSLAAELGDDGYALDVTQGGIHIRAPWSAGLFYALQTLRQLLPASLDASMDASIEAGRTLALPCLSIRDRPRYSWRGFMLDEARHFFGIETVKRILDWMACLKLNRFHWHLTDDQGWRVEIAQYPRLTEIGGRREGTQVGSFLYRKATIDPTPHEGWYTQRQIREIVDYAAARHITVVPEIDLPGHFSAALAAYPHLGCGARPTGVRSRWGLSEAVACVGSPQTVAFLRDVLDELCALFPGRWIHLGGDGVKTDRWQTCPHCRRVKRRYSYADWHDLTTHTMNVLAVHLRRRDKSAVVWNDALRPALSKNVVVMHWTPGARAMRRTKQALLDGYSVVLQTWQESNFDYPHTVIPLRSVYRARTLDDVTPEKAAATADNVLGTQGALWTEFVADEPRIQFNVFPRLAAKAQVGWAPPSPERDLAAFKQRWQALLPHLERMGLAHAAPLAASDPGPVRQVWDLLRDLPRGDLQAEQARWQTAKRRKP